MAEEQKRRALAVIVSNVCTLRNLMRRNRADFAAAVSRDARLNNASRLVASVGSAGQGDPLGGRDARPGEAP